MSVAVPAALPVRSLMNCTVWPFTGWSCASCRVSVRVEAVVPSAGMVSGARVRADFDASATVEVTFTAALPCASVSAFCITRRPSA